MKRSKRSGARVKRSKRMNSLRKRIARKNVTRKKVARKNVTRKKVARKKVTRTSKRKISINKNKKSLKTKGGRYTITKPKHKGKHPGAGDGNAGPVKPGDGPGAGPVVNPGDGPGAGPIVNPGDGPGAGPVVHPGDGSGSGPFVSDGSGSGPFVKPGAGDGSGSGPFVNADEHHSLAGSLHDWGAAHPAELAGLAVAGTALAGAAAAAAYKKGQSSPLNHVIGKRERYSITGFGKRTKNHVVPFEQLDGKIVGIPPNLDVEWCQLILQKMKDENDDSDDMFDIFAKNSVMTQSTIKGWSTDTYSIDDEKLLNGELFKGMVKTTRVPRKGKKFGEKSPDINAIDKKFSQIHDALKMHGVACCQCLTMETSKDNNNPKKVYKKRDRLKRVEGFKGHIPVIGKEKEGESHEVVYTYKDDNGKTVEIKFTIILKNEDNSGSLPFAKKNGDICEFLLKEHLRYICYLIVLLNVQSLIEKNKLIKEDESTFDFFEVFTREGIYLEVYRLYLEKSIKHGIITDQGEIHVAKGFIKTIEDKNFYQQEPEPEEEEEEEEEGKPPALMEDLKKSIDVFLDNDPDNEKISEFIINNITKNQNLTDDDRQSLRNYLLSTKFIKDLKELIDGFMANNHSDNEIAEFIINNINKNQNLTDDDRQSLKQYLFTTKIKKADGKPDIQRMTKITRLLVEAKAHSA